ncbi:hypothetical protein DQ384_18480 [Sphaerisporangium album]|uniref:Uncharacterized protein n=1 Tax=Sphaerisporangium album TaxID=509200 RepID=A0A367FIR4_9ACTN|nr:hypothetical protein [Sphaerisporangium album]RCG29587.1 hypothetical protein DQ384_18480 [Sphaerisporangium album]
MRAVLAPVWRTLAEAASVAPIRPAFARVTVLAVEGGTRIPAPAVVALEGAPTSSRTVITVERTRRAVATAGEAVSSTPLGPAVERTAALPAVPVVPVRRAATTGGTAVVTAVAALARSAAVIAVRRPAFPVAALVAVVRTPPLALTASLTAERARTRPASPIVPLEGPAATVTTVAGLGGTSAAIIRPVGTTTVVRAVRPPAAVVTLGPPIAATLAAFTPVPVTRLRTPSLTRLRTPSLTIGTVVPRAVRTTAWAAITVISVVGTLAAVTAPLAAVGGAAVTIRETAGTVPAVGTVPAIVPVEPAAARRAAAPFTIERPVAAALALERTSAPRVTIAGPVGAGGTAFTTLAIAWTVPRTSFPGRTSAVTLRRAVVPASRGAVAAEPARALARAVTAFVGTARVLTSVVSVHFCP